MCYMLLEYTLNQRKKLIIGRRLIGNKGVVSQSEVGIYHSLLCSIFVHQLESELSADVQNFRSKSIQVKK